MNTTITATQSPSRASNGSLLLTALHHEWEQIHHSSATTDTLRRWATLWPVLAGHDNFDDVLAALDAASAQRQDRILTALVQLLHDGDQLAGRVLVEAFRPGLISLARKVRHPRDYVSFDDRLQRTVTAFWEVTLLDGSKPRTARRVAARLHLGTLHKLTAHLRLRHTDDVHVTRWTTAEEVLERRGVNDRPRLPGPPTSDSDLTELLLWARDTLALTGPEVALLAEVYLAGSTINALATRDGVKAATLRRRVDRARTRLTTAARAAADGAAAA